jgi:calcineurin-like phosphoesterase family protein
MSRVFVISDLHLGHNNLALKRGFAGYLEQDQLIIDNWNSVVSKNDLVWILGDIAMSKNHYQKLNLLKGYKNVVLGNHDASRYVKELQKYVNQICGMKSIHNHLLTHCPIHESQFFRYAKNIHGHIHEHKLNDERYINVCCEQLDYTPKLLSDIIKD